MVEGVMDDKSQQRRVLEPSVRKHCSQSAGAFKSGATGCCQNSRLNGKKGLLPSIPAIMAWYADWEARKEALLKVGLPVLVRGVELRNGFLSITLDADEACLLRTHAARGFDLHVSLGYIQEYDSPIDALEASMRLHNRWAGQLVLLNIAWVGSGGAAFLHEYDLINEDPDFQCLYIRGRYWKRGAHVSL